VTAPAKPTRAFLIHGHEPLELTRAHRRAVRDRYRNARRRGVWPDKGPYNRSRARHHALSYACALEAGRRP